MKLASTFAAHSIIPTKGTLSHTITALTILLTLSVMTPQALAVEYFVNKRGLDTNAGTSREAAFLTIQKGLDAVQSGDTLTIGRGEYFESLTRPNLGHLESETVIRAEIPGTVVLRGDVAAPEFQLLAGTDRTYVADFRGPLHAIYEVDTQTSLTYQATLPEVEFQAGSYFYDSKKEKLYISSTDTLPVDTHRYSIPVSGGHGLVLENPKRVVIDGLAARGFEKATMQRPDTKFNTWAIVLLNSEKCIVRHCTVLLNGGGVFIGSGKALGGNLIEHSVGYGNFSPHNFESGSFVVVAVRNDTLSHCTSFNSNMGVRIYGGDGYGLIENSLGWGNHVDVGIKVGKSGGICEVKDSVALAALPNRGPTHHSIIGNSNTYKPNEPAGQDTSIRLNFERVNQDQEFADPMNFDFRLQSTSSLRGSAPDGSDRGPHPFQPHIFYVKPGGDDAADGLSLKTAWKTLPRATKSLKPGDTVYFEQGVYEGEAAITAGTPGAKPILLRARGTGKVVFPGVFHIDQSAGLSFERLNFSGQVDVTDSQAITFHNCRFFSKGTGLGARSVQGLKVSHCEFSGFTQSALLLEGTTEAEQLSSNIYDNAQGTALHLRSIGEAQPKVLYSDYNSYSDAAKAWLVGDTLTSLAELRQGQEIYSREWQARTAIRDGIPEMLDVVQLIDAGALGRRIGVHQDLLSNTVRMTPPKVHSLSATTANIEWAVSRRVACDIAWGETPACENKATFRMNIYNDDFRSYSLTGLKPDTTYYFRISQVKPLRPAGEALPLEVANPRYEVISFKTAKSDPPPRVYYVAPDGKDSASGLERSHAWRSIAHAASRVLPGDTVMVAAGVYGEKVRVRATGEKDLPITFRSIPGEKVVLDGLGRRLDTAFVINGKNHIAVDGFYFRGFIIGGQGSTSPRVINVIESNNITLRRCFWDGRGAGYSGGLLVATDSKDILLSNSVMIRGSDGLEASSCPGLRIENCVFIGHMIEAMKLGSPAVLSSNIICDSSLYKAKSNIHFVSIGTQDDVVDQNNCYFLRTPEEERTLFWLINFREGGKLLGHKLMTLPDYKKRVAPTDSIVADPRFAVFKRLDAAKNPPFVIDRLVGNEVALDFADLFATNPEVLKRGMGLQPSAFADMLPPTVKARAGE